MCTGKGVGVEWREGVLPSTVYPAVAGSYFKCLRIDRGHIGGMLGYMRSTALCSFH